MFIWNVELAWNFNKRRLHSSPYVGHLKLCAEERRDLLAFKAVWYTKKRVRCHTHIYIYKMSPADNWNEYASQMDGVLFGILVFFASYHGAIFCYALPWYRLIFYIFNNKYAALHWFVSFFLFDSISEIDEIATVTRKRPVSLWNQ